MVDDFQTTRWSMVLAAADRDPDGDRALAWLCEAYWFPLYAFVRRRGHDADTARDLVQAFFLRVLEKDYLRGLDPAAGKFRAFLLASIKHFVSNELARSRAEKRRADNPGFTVQLDQAEELYQREAPQGLNAEELYERRWAATVLRRATDRLGHEYRESGRGELFDRLKGFLTGEADLSYAMIAGELDMNEGAVKTAIHRLRQRLGKALRDEVAQTIADSGQVDDEIRYLLRVVG